MDLVQLASGVIFHQAPDQPGGITKGIRPTRGDHDSDQPPGITMSVRPTPRDHRGRFDRETWLALVESINISDCIFYPDFAHPSATPRKGETWVSVWYNYQNQGNVKKKAISSKFIKFPKLRIGLTRRIYTPTNADLSVQSRGWLSVDPRHLGNSENRLANFLEGKILKKIKKHSWHENQ